MTANSQQIASAIGRERQVLDLRAGGASFEQIGQALGVSAGRVRHIVSRAYKRAPHPHADVMREEQNRQLDRLQMTWWPKALGTPGNPDAGVAASPADPAAFDKIMKIMERRARLNGLDAPIRVQANVEVITMDAVTSEIEQLRQELATHDVRFQARSTPGPLALGPASASGSGGGTEPAAPSGDAGPMASAR